MQLSHPSFSMHTPNSHVLFGLQLPHVIFVPKHFYFAIWQIRVKRLYIWNSLPPVATLSLPIGLCFPRLGRGEFLVFSFSGYGPAPLVDRPFVIL